MANTLYAARRGFWAEDQTIALTTRTKYRRIPDLVSTLQGWILRIAAQYFKYQPARPAGTAMEGGCAVRPD